MFVNVCFVRYLFGFDKKPHKGTKNFSNMQINIVLTRSFLIKMSIFTHIL